MINKDLNIEPLDIPDDYFTKVEDLENGDSVYEIGEPVEEIELTDQSFHANLAESYNESDLKKLAAELNTAVDEDILSRKEWMETVTKVQKYLGLSLEAEGEPPFREATRTFDTTLLTGVIRAYATARTELLPPDGPVGYRLLGSNDESLKQKGEDVKDFLNYYLTTVDKGYYADMEKFLWYWSFAGCVFRKVYYDPITSKPVSRFIIPQDFVVNNDCSSILESDRLTQIRHLSRREIMLHIKSGAFREAELPYLKNPENADIENINEQKQPEVDLDVYTKRSQFPIYETHAYLNLADYFDITNDELAIPLPYIVTWCKTSQEVISIRRNWLEDDPLQNRINYFVQHNYLPGFGIYGVGIAHLAGTNAITLTKLERVLVDAGLFQNLQGGLRQKGFKQQNNDLIVGPGEFVEVDTGSVPLREAFMPLPYSGPSQALRELRQEIIAQTRDLISTSETALSDSRENMAVGTTMALLETSNRIQSAVLRSLHSSLSLEFQLLYKMFKETIGIETFNAQGTEKTIAADDFIEEIQIIPTSDPSTDSVTQRIIRAESILKIASGAPQLHNMRAIYQRVYQALGVQDIDNILPPEQQVESPEQEQQPQVDPNALLMADIQQKTQETIVRERIANLKAETDVFRAQLDFEKNKLKLEQDKELAELKAETEAFKEQLIFERNKAKMESDNAIAELKAQIELLKTELTTSKQEDIAYEL